MTHDPKSHIKMARNYTVCAVCFKTRIAGRVLIRMLHESAVVRMLMGQDEMVGLKIPLTISGIVCAVPALPILIGQ